MRKEIHRSILSGKADAPSCAALAHRAIFVASFSPGQTIVSNVPQTKDIEATIEACKAFGADIVIEKDIADIFGIPSPLQPFSVDCNESNTTLKLFLPLASLFDREIEFTGSERLSKMRISNFSKYLSAAGVSIETQNNHLPMKVKGPLSGVEFPYLNLLGSQFLSGILLCAPLRGEDTSVGIIGGELSGRYYIEWTCELMKKSKILFEACERNFFYIRGVQNYLPPKEIAVPGSICLSSFLLLAGILSGKAAVEKVDRSLALESLFSSFGGKAKSEEGKFSVSTSAFEGTKLDCADIGEYILHALVLACLADGKTEIKNIALLPPRQKKHVQLAIRELKKMGADISEAADSITISGGKLSGAIIEPEGDAKVAMACAAAGVAAKGKTVINEAECIASAYPNFFEELEKLGTIVR